MGDPKFFKNKKKKKQLNNLFSGHNLFYFAFLFIFLQFNYTHRSIHTIVLGNSKCIEK